MLPQTAVVFPAVHFSVVERKFLLRILSDAEKTDVDYDEHDDHLHQRRAMGTLELGQVCLVPGIFSWFAGYCDS
jgi:hypothetical protein